MPRRLSIYPYLSIDELEQRYRQAETVIERSHYQILWLLAKGKPSEEVAEVTGYRRNWIYELVRSYNRLGVAALGDLRRYNRGALPKLEMFNKLIYCKRSEVLRQMADCGMDAKLQIT